MYPVRFSREHFRKMLDTVQRSLYEDIASGGCRMLPAEFRDLLLCKGATATGSYGASKQFEYDTEAFRNRVGAFLCNGLRCSYLIDAETLTFGADSANQFNLNPRDANKISDLPQLDALRGSGWMQFRVGFHALVGDLKNQQTQPQESGDVQAHAQAAAPSTATTAGGSALAETPMQVLQFDPDRDLEGELKAVHEEMQRVEKLSPEEQAEEKVAEIENIIEGESDWRGIGETAANGGKASGIGSGDGGKQQDNDEDSTSSGSEDEDEDYGGSCGDDKKYYKDPFGSKNGGTTPGGGHTTEYSTDDDDADIPDLVDVAQWNSKTRINKKAEVEQQEQVEGKASPSTTCTTTSPDLTSPPGGDCDNKTTSTNNLQEPQQRDEKLVQEPLPPLTLEFARELKATRHARKLFVGDNEKCRQLPVPPGAATKPPLSSTVRTGSAASAL